jgi:hypothetical protein
MKPEGYEANSVANAVSLQNGLHFTEGRQYLSGFYGQRYTGFVLYPIK